MLSSLFHNPPKQTVIFHFSMSLGPLGSHSRRHEDRKNNQGVSGLQHQHIDSGQPAKRGCWRNNARQPMTENQPQAICGMSYCWQLNCCLNVKIIKKVYFPCLILMFIPVTSICVRAEWFQQRFCRLVLQTQLKKLPDGKMQSRISALIFCDFTTSMYIYITISD